ncbi:contactin-6 isoform X2 [Nematostella vectensis]|nr:contactin-6 isoform X2 [Nematostella vectensis]XP_048582932.1 contactin-6 isoform X2 [Nematostella vectensis]XP_048582937.1 contactin-6 isoform X2 [Nematostella vectensis]XP_048582941.1 contactin-6 isoform X2 [Nematostella vectensis]XP_048582943.1 contactin-6 isoform X2 [Nematostella vectensis]XP_048582949.1 contactin-6 isoform X2 [Nematostella vectensis]XP_048582954.1 contactin-6 isoform X2 [Nematostella vectensis]XP_048582958.1 contactin-6 isoform X2 [Nematostella vectensis]XP_04858296
MLKIQLLLYLLILGSLEALGSTSKPQIIVGPKDTLVHGTSFTLMCIATKDSTVTWYHDGNRIDFQWQTNMQQSKDGSLHVTNAISSRDKGPYRCVVSNSRGTIISRRANVKFPYLMPFAVTNFVIGKEESHSAVLHCQAPDSYPDRQIQWSKQDPNFPGRRRPLPQSSKYTISSEGDLHFAYLEQSDSGDYVCTVTNNNINKQQVRTVVLNVMPVRPLIPQPPKISTEFSVTKIALKGERFVLECIVYGMPVPKITLRKKGVHMILGQVTGNARRHYIPKFTANHAGKYKCKATDTSGRTDTSTTIVRMEAKPEWITRPQDTITGVNSNTTLRCHASGAPRVFYQWYYNGQPLVTSQRHILHQGDLILKELRYSDGGMYQCVVTNTHGQLIASAELTVAETPAGFGQGSRAPEASKNALVDSTVTLHCRPSGNPKPIVRWRKGSVYLSSGPRYQFLTSGDLMISNVTSLDSGRYTCEVSNRLGSASRTGRLNVQDKIAVTHPPDNKIATVGGTVRFTCGVTTSGVTEVVFQWRRFAFLLQPSSRISMGKIGEQTGFLEIRGVEFSDQGLYACKATGSIQKADASSEAFALLNVQGAPEKPHGVTILPNTQFSHLVNLTWKLGRDNGSPITHVIIQQHVGSASDKWTVAKVIRDPKTRIAEVTLSPWAEYKFRVIAGNAIGNSTPSQVSMSVSTRPEAPSKFPSGIKSKGKGPNTMQITWKPLSRLEENAPGIYYIVYYKRADVKDAMKRNEVHNKTRFTIVGTDYYVKYAFQVQAANDRGFGPKSGIMFGFSGERYPVGRPTNLKIEITSPTSALATWTSIVDSREVAGGKLLGYKVYFWTDVTDIRPGKSPFKSSIRASTVLDLDAFTSYRFQVVAFNGRGDGPGSNIVGPIRTPMASLEEENKSAKRQSPDPTPRILTPDIYRIPDPPAAIVVGMQNTSYVVLSWHPPIKPNGPILSYSVSVKRLSDGKTVSGETNGTTELRVHNLNLRSRYQFAIMARNHIGASPPVVGEFDMELFPRKPPTFVRVNYDEFQREAKVTWIRVASRVDGYKVYYWGEDNIVESVDVDMDRNKRTITRLENGHVYHFQVAAFRLVDGQHFVIGPRSDPVKAGRAPVQAKVESTSDCIHLSGTGTSLALATWGMLYLLYS